MSVISVAREVALKVGLEEPGSLAAPVDRSGTILRVLMDQCLEEIVRDHPWRRLSRLNETAIVPGEFAEEDFAEEWLTAAQLPLPSDFHYVENDTQFWLSTYHAPLRQYLNKNDWVADGMNQVEGFVPGFIIYGESIYIRPSPTITTTVKYFYQTHNVIVHADGTAGPTITDDDDTFRIPERLVRLSMIWRYRADQAGLSYSDQLQDYEKALAQEIGREAGPTFRAIGFRRVPRIGAQLAWPRPIIP